MRSLLVAAITLISSVSFAQPATGKFGTSLDLAYNPTNRSVTGYYSAAGKKGAQPCSFYIKGTLKDTVALIETFAPGDKYNDYSIGTLVVKSEGEVSMVLSKDHFGCSSTFSKEPVKLTVGERNKYTSIHYVDTDKSAVRSETPEGKIAKELKRGAVVYVDRAEGEWSHVTIMGKAVTEGWMKTETLNK